MDLRPVIQKELVCLFLTEEAYSHGSLQTRELGQTPLYRRNLNGLGLKIVLVNRPDPVLVLHSVVMILMHKLHLGKRGKFDPDKNSWHLSVSSLSAYF